MITPAITPAGAKSGSLDLVNALPTETDKGNIIQADEADSKAQSAFTSSIVVSAIRCTLTYVVFPFLAGFVGLAPGIGPAIGLPLGLFAIGANFFSIRRFWRADHRWKKPVTVLHVGVIILLTILVVGDINDLFG